MPPSKRGCSVQCSQLSEQCWLPFLVWRRFLKTLQPLQFSPAHLAGHYSSPNSATFIQIIRIGLRGNSLIHRLSLAHLPNSCGLRCIHLRLVEPADSKCVAQSMPPFVLW